jgi:hypothetical protein
LNQPWVRPAQLALLAGQMVVGRGAIAHYIPAKGAPQQLDGSSRRPTQALNEHRHHGGDHHPLPAALAVGIAFVGIAGGCAGFIHVGHRLLTGKSKGLLHGLLQCCPQALADHGDRPTADLHPQQLIEQPLGLAETQQEGTAQQAHQGTEPGAVTAGLHISWQQSAGAGGTSGADQAMQTVLDHQRREQGAAAATGVRVVLHHLVHPLDWQQLRSRSGMARLAAALAATAFAALRRLKSRTVTGGRFGGIVGAATVPLPQR